MAHYPIPLTLSRNDNAKRLMLAFCVTATFMVIESLAAYFRLSGATTADAGHMLTDAAALLFALLAYSLRVVLQCAP